MKHIFPCGVPLILLLSLIVISHTSARFLHTKPGEEMVQHDESKNTNEGSPVDIETINSFDVGMDQNKPANELRKVCDFTGDGEFRVRDIRTTLDNLFFPSSVVATRWVKHVPIKVNIFAWRARLDRLPTRGNLISRGVLLDSSYCPNCDLATEDSHHLFLRCDLAKIKLKAILEGVFFTSWWHLWLFRNRLLFDTSPPKRSVLFEDIVSSSFYGVLIDMNRKWRMSLPRNVDFREALDERGIASSPNISGSSSVTCPRVLRACVDKGFANYIYLSKTFFLGKLVVYGENFEPKSIPRLVAPISWIFGYFDETFCQKFFLLLGPKGPICFSFPRNSDHPGMVLTNTPFNGSNFLGWSRTVKMALVAAYFNKLKKCWDELHNLNGVPVCSCGKMKECTCNLVDKFLEIEGRSRLVRFLMKLDNDYESIRNQILPMDPLPNVNKAYYIVQQVEKKKQMTNHMADLVAFFANMNQNKFVKRDTRGEQSNLGLDQKLVVVVCQKAMKMMNGKSYASTSGATPGYGVAHGFMHHADLSTKEAVAIGKGSRYLYTCTYFDPSASPSTQNSVVNSINVFDFLNNPIVSNSVHHNVVDLHTLHAKLGHLFMSKMIHGPYKIPTLNGAHYFYTIVDDKSRATRTYLVYTKDQVLTILSSFLKYAETHFKANTKFLRSDNGTEVVNSRVLDLLRVPPGQKGYKLYNLSTHEVIHNRDVVFQESVFPFKEPVTTFVLLTVKPVCYLDLSTDEEVDVPEAPTTNHLLDLTTEPIHTHKDNVEPLPNTNQPYNSPQNIPTRISAKSTIAPKWIKDLERLKARLVAKGFNQEEGLDYKHTFSLVAKLATVRVIIALAIEKGWPLHQLDVNNSFLHGNIDEELYMLPPEGYTMAKPACKPNPSPLPTSLHLSFDKGTPLTDAEVYRRQFVSTPKDTHMQAALYLLKYLKGTIFKGLYYPVQSLLKLTGFSYADWANCLMTRRSLTGYCIFLGHSLVSWKTKKQPTVSRSSTETEYKSMATTTYKLLWLEHVDIDCHFTREKVQDGFLQTAHILSYLQLADILTKALNQV
nr:hypothetical protein [Tanacetum cinerariifolium]